MNDLRPIVQELFSRSVAGVFALRENEQLIVQPRPGANWSLNLGLAARLQQAPIKPMLRPHRDRDVQTVDDLTGPYGPLDPGQYETATTDHLLAELYRHGSQMAWVLGLFRPRKFRGHWSGLCWNGRPITCSGLASCLVGQIADQIQQLRAKQGSQEVALSDDLRVLLTPVLRNASAARPSRTFMAGLCTVAAIYAGTYGDDADPGTDANGMIPGDDNGLAGFVRLD